jgi:thiol-disulfide isomerase/thioredoxin
LTKIFFKPGLFIFFLIVACNNAEKKVAVDNKLSSSILDKVKLANLNNEQVDLSLYKGKYVFINFWATWCKPCVFEMPSLKNLSEKLKGENIVFLFASDESGEQIAEFKQSNNYSMEFARVESLADLNISAIPTTYIFDTNGTLAFTETGARQWDSEESIAMVTKIINK